MGYEMREAPDDAKFVVCSRERYHADDIQTVCAECGVDVFHRPDVPKGPPKVCLLCMLEKLRP